MGSIATHTAWHIVNHVACHHQQRSQRLSKLGCRPPVPCTHIKMKCMVHARRSGCASKLHDTSGLLLHFKHGPGIRSAYMPCI